MSGRSNSISSSCSLNGLAQCIWYFQNTWNPTTFKTENSVCLWACNFSAWSSPKSKPILSFSEIPDISLIIQQEELAPPSLLSTAESLLLTRSPSKVFGRSVHMAVSSALYSISLTCYCSQISVSRPTPDSPFDLCLLNFNRHFKLNIQSQILNLSSNSAPFIVLSILVHCNSKWNSSFSEPKPRVIPNCLFNTHNTVERTSWLCLCSPPPPLTLWRTTIIVVLTFSRRLDIGLAT